MFKPIYILRRKELGDVAVMTLKFILDEYIEKKCWNKVVWRAFAIVMNL